MKKNKPNKLINEKSPYLLQHAYNPVNWYPWSDEAFNKAKMENKPVFLSVGYSTCHWCHVMEKESFEDEKIAELLNDSFISIKVDREERPDIDNIYMSVCQMLTGGGGWPLTVIMTPEQRPFFAGTYFPKYTKRNRIGMIELIPQLAEAWIKQADKINSSADEITSHLSINFQSENKTISEELLDKAYFSFEERFDHSYGGFGTRPKFPSPHNLLFLLRYNHLKKGTNSLDMVNKTLIEMRKGGIFDHIGFGFHRYSTDEKWFLPHFEKMLYDQAMHIIAYSEAFLITKDKLFEQTVNQTIEYILRDMTSQNGGFYSAEDADSEGEEGKFYLWSKEEIIDLLGENEGSLFTEIFGFESLGNFYEESTGDRNGTNIPYLRKSIDSFKYEFKGEGDNLYKKLDSMREKIFEKREKRVHPYKDDKILTDWNGLMIAALSKAGKTFNNKKFTEAAEKCAEFICEKLIDNKGKLLHRYRDGEAGINAKLDDYAFLIWGLIELYETEFNVKYLKRASDLCSIVIEEFWDHKNNSGFYFTSENDEELISRSKEFYDGAIPSGNSVMYLNLLKLGKTLNNSEYLDISEKLGLTISSIAEKAPAGFSFFLSGLLFYFGPSVEIVVAGKKEDDKTKKIFELINAIFAPNRIIISLDESNSKEIAEIIPFVKNFDVPPNDTMVYICKNFNCELPTNDLNEIEKRLRSVI